MRYFGLTNELGGEAEINAVRRGGVAIIAIMLGLAGFHSCDREKVKQVGTYNGAVIERHTESFGRSRGDYVVTMPEGYVCVGGESLEERTNEYDVSTNKDGIKVTTRRGAEDLVIDVSKSFNREIIERDLGYKVTNSGQLEPYKRKCLQAIIGYNKSKMQEDEK